MKDIELPPLPEPDHFAFIDGGHGIYVEGGPTGEPFYSAEQIHDYARSAVEADRAQRVLEGCYLSWGGFNIHGDSKSIQEVNRLMHEAGTVPDLKAMLAQSYKELAKEAPELCDPSCKTYDVAAMVMSDCGHSTNNQRLLDRIAARIDKHVESLLASTPAQPAQQPKPSPIKAEHTTVYPSGTRVTRLELTDEAKESLRADVPHIPGQPVEREPMTWDQMREFIETHAESNIVAYCVIGMNKLMEFIGKVERFHGITKKEQQ